MDKMDQATIEQIHNALLKSAMPFIGTSEVHKRAVAAAMLGIAASLFEETVGIAGAQHMLRKVAADLDNTDGQSLTGSRPKLLV